MRKGGVAATLSKIDCLCQMSMNQYAINKKTSVSTGFLCCYVMSALFFCEHGTF